MAKKHVFTLTLAEGTTAYVPVKSGKRKTSALNLARLFRRLASGTTPGIATLNARQTATAASAIVTCAAVEAADTVTINGQALTATQHHATGTVTIVVANTDNDDTVTINGEEFTAAAAEDTAAGEFDISGTDTEAAVSLAACIAANAALSGVVETKLAAGVVTIRAASAGTAGNDITLESSDADGLAVSAATLENGAAVANNQFDFTGTNTQTGAALVAAIAASSTNIVSKHVAGVNASGAVTLTALVPGHSGNAITIATSNGTRLAITGGVSRLTGGTDTLTTMTF